MKTAITILLSLFLTTVSGQTDNLNVLLDSAKALFKSACTLNRDEFEKFDFTPVASLLEKVVGLNPNNAEARYFLGYTYSRMNARDGQRMTV